MKYLVIICDGMADHPIESLGGRTPLESARTPAFDELARMGAVGMVRTLPGALPPGSDVAILSILGYDPAQYYCGRAPLEAANMGVDLQEGDVVFRCNLVTVDGERLIDYSAGHVTSKESSQLIELLNQQLGSASLIFAPGVGYRHLMRVRDPKRRAALLEAKCDPPHDIMGQRLADHWPRGSEGKGLQGLMERSRAVLDGHEINRVRIDLKENPANMIWLWGQGPKVVLPTFGERFGVSGAAISAVDVIRGTARLVGFELVQVPGATGYYDTNYAGKIDHALAAFQQHDFVLLHIEATDEASHNGDLEQKLAAIGQIDRLVMPRVIEALKTIPDLRVLTLPDHATPVALRTHILDPVPFLLVGAGIPPSGAARYNETTGRASEWLIEPGTQLMPLFLQTSELRARVTR